jgi:CDP-glycerol glycerophosphotransferase (TagB/SpsB family)
LITDHSSVGNEYTLLDQPIVFYETDDLRKHYSDKQIDHVMIERRPGVSVDRVEALKEAVQHALDNPAELSEQRKALATYLFHLPGTATLRAIEQIHALLDVEPFLPTKWAIDAAHREADALREMTEKVDIRPFAERPRTP